MKISIKSSLALLLAVFVLSASVTAAEDKYSSLRLVLAKTFPGVDVNSLNFKSTGVKDLLEFNLGAQVLYVSKDGRFLIRGDLYDLVSQENLTEASAQKTRVALLESFGEKNMLIFEPEKRKHFITVFTDVDCPYCRKLHEEVGEYMKNGIAVRYLFLPFKGKKSLEKSVSIWCSKNPQDAMTRAKQGQKVENATCENPINEHMAVGREFGIRGTPAIVMENGEMIPGYRPVAEVVKIFNSQSSAAKK